MTPAERIYQVILWLYPAEHRRDFGQPMLQHARDLGRAARQRGRLYEFSMYLRLTADCLTNAIKEHGAVLRSKNDTYKPIPWLSVLLAAVPGLWVALTRRQPDVLAPLLPILGNGFLLLIIIGLPIMWWRKRQFPVCGLMFAGALIWFLTYKAGTGFFQQLFLSMRLYDPFGFGMGVMFLNIVLATILFVLLLRRQRLKRVVWILAGLIVIMSFAAALSYGLIKFGSGFQVRDLFQYWMAALSWPAEGLMFVAVGLLAARQHGILALLIVVGGYSYQFLDTDYLFGYPARDWPGLPFYLFIVSFLCLVVIPVTMLRATTRFSRALAVFVPVVVFLVVRLTVPLLATGQSLAVLRPGDILLSITVFLILILAWLLYSHMAVPHEAQYDPLPGR